MFASYLLLDASPAAVYSHITIMPREAKGGLWFLIANT